MFEVKLEINIQGSTFLLAQGNYQHQLKQISGRRSELEVAQASAASQRAELQARLQLQRKNAGGQERPCQSSA